MKLLNWKKKAWFSNRSSDTRLTLCIPAYKAASFINETIKSAIAQDYVDIKILISVDACTLDNTLELLQEYEQDKRIKIFSHKTRLGWAGNLNFLMGQVDTKYMCILPHDDILHQSFATELINILIQNSNAIAAHCDINCFGLTQGVIPQQSVVGQQKDRIIDYLENHFNAVLFRAIIDRARISGPLHFKSNLISDFAEDTIWGLRLAIQGEIIRLPKVLYDKRYHEDSHHSTWINSVKEKGVSAWLQHCIGCVLVLKEHGVIKDNPELYIGACINRLFQRKTKMYPLQQVDLKQEQEVLNKFIVGII